MNQDGTYTAKFIGGNADGETDVPFPLYAFIVTRNGTVYQHTGWEALKMSAPGPLPDEEDPFGEKRPVIAVYEPLSLINGDTS